jgi:hypothetical protein
MSVPFRQYNRYTYKRYIILLCASSAVRDTAHTVCAVVVLLEFVHLIVVRFCIFELVRVSCCQPF